MTEAIIETAESGTDDIKKYRDAYRELEEALLDIGIGFGDAPEFHSNDGNVQNDACFISDSGECFPEVIKEPVDCPDVL